MGECQSLLLRYYCSRHGRREIVHNNHRVGLVTAQISLEAGHHLSRQFVQIVTVHTQIHLRLRHLQVVEKRLLQCRVVLASGIYKMMTDVHSPSVRAVYCPHDRSEFYEIGSCTRYYTYFHYLFTLL